MNVTKWKKPICKGYILYDSTIWHSERGLFTMEAVRKDQQLPGDRGKERVSETQGLLGQWNYSRDIITVGTCQYTFVQTHRMSNAKSEPPCELWTLEEGGVLVQVPGL